jgi:hypothetical protein
MVAGGETAMPPVNWDAFGKLPGAAEHNFEMLCRALIRLHYGRHGEFVALAAQPGVEFHLKLRTPCALGNPGRWYGWQCRWYDLPGGRAIGAGRREKIEAAVGSTEKKIPHLTDWVLWTRRPLTKGDQTWFYGLKTSMTLHLWTAADVEDHLSGDAEILRGTYFDELVLTPRCLTDLHRAAVARIRQRWQPEVHQIMDAERALRRMLGDIDTWDDLQKLAVRLKADTAAVEGDLRELAGPVAESTSAVAEHARAAAVALADAHAVLGRGDLDLMRQQLASRPGIPGPKLAALPRHLRAGRHHAALAVTNALADARLAGRLLDVIDTHLGTGLVAVTADAGCGKTHLAAQLTATVGDRPPGILLYGSDLHAGQSLDGLARSVVIQGKPVPSMEALVAAVHAAGERAWRRLPIVIDGLNEAQDPRDWKGQLASLDETLRHYPYTCVVCTVRTAFADEVLPPDVRRLEIPDFGLDTVEAIRRYFAHYRIDPADAELPSLLSHPLTLRLFCEVTNPTRERTVGLEAMPGSLTALFDRYLDQAAARIAELAPRTRRYYEQDVRTALDEIGAALWEEKTRNLGLAALRRRLGDAERPWNESIVRALEQDGILLRAPRDRSNATHVTAAYDALAGHLVADSVLARRGSTGLEEWLRDPVTVTSLSGPLPEQHPLATDTFRALVGLLPRRLHRQQLWPLLDEPLRTLALRYSADLEDAYLDALTVAKLATLVTEPPTGSRDLLDRLWQTRGSSTHPLNAEFLEGVLRPMAVADRDLRWTEWVRRRQDKVLVDLRILEKRWRNKPERTSADRLRARWVMWTLTSTVRELRDQATRTLYWFGRGDPAALFSLTLDALGINDLYVPERLLAASYGVTVAHQFPDLEFANALSAFLTKLCDALVGPRAACPTSHFLARLYVRGMISVARTYHRSAVPDALEGDAPVPFASGPTVDPIVGDDPRASEVNQTLHTDFENYTLGRLLDDRANYDMGHPGYESAVAHVRGVVWTLGWRAAGLGIVDNGLTSYSSPGTGAKTDRYGKKYGWIGFYTYAGMLDDDGRLPTDGGRLSDVDIDPSFPEPPPPAPIDLPIWARPSPTDARRWIRHGVVAVPDALLCRPDLDGHSGPWIAVAGHLTTGDQAPGRRVFGILKAMLVAAADTGRLVHALNARDHPGRVWLPEEPGDYYTFAGEIPWSPEFARGGEDDDRASLYRATVPVDDGSPIEVEILAHGYDWERYHSGLNVAGGALVPSQTFSAAFGLRGIPQSFSQTLPDGTVGALSLGAPVGFRGHLLYLREDLVQRYAAGRRLIWFVWGERQIYPHPSPAPGWLIRTARKNADVWRQTRKGDELSRAFASDLELR